MAFKKIESKIGFAPEEQASHSTGQAGLAFASSMDKNRTLRTLEQMNKVINWARIEKILKKYYKMRPLHNPSQKTLNEPFFLKLCFKNIHKY